MLGPHSDLSDTELYRLLLCHYIDYGEAGTEMHLGKDEN